MEESTIQEARSRGGLAKATNVRAGKQWMELAKGLELQQLPDLLVGAGLAAMEGKVEPAQVNALAAACRAAVGIVEIAGMEARLRELEELLTTLEGRHARTPGR